MITDQNREVFRLQLLQTASYSAPMGVSISLFRTYAKTAGFPKVTEDQVAAEVQYLADKGLLVSVDKRISPENTAWRITADGRDFLAQQNLD